MVMCQKDHLICVHCFQPLNQWILGILSNWWSRSHLQIYTKDFWFWLQGFMNIALHFLHDLLGGNMKSDPFAVFITYSSSSEFISISLEKYEKIGLFIGSDFKRTSSQSHFFPNSTVQDTSKQKKCVKDVIFW